LFLHKTFKALNGLLCADVPLRNYSLTHVKKVVVKILQGSVVTQTTLGGLTIHPPVACSVYVPTIMKIGWQ